MRHVLQADATRLIADTSAKVKAAIGIVVVDVLARAAAKSALHGELFVLCGRCLGARVNALERACFGESMLWTTVFRCLYWAIAAIVIVRGRGVKELASSLGSSLYSSRCLVIT